MTTAKIGIAAQRLVTTRSILSDVVIAFFLFFGFFGFFFEGKMSHMLIDERYTENRAKAQLTVNISLTVEAPIEEIFIFE